MAKKALENIFGGEPTLNSYEGTGQYAAFLDGGGGGGGRAPGGDILAFDPYTSPYITSRKVFFTIKICGFSTKQKNNFITKYLIYT